MSASSFPGAASSNELVRPNWQVAHADAGQRVGNGIADRGRDRRQRRFAHAFGAVRTVGVRRFRRAAMQIRQGDPAWGQKVIEKRTVDRPAVVEAHFFEYCRTEAGECRAFVLYRIASVNRFADVYGVARVPMRSPLCRSKLIAEASRIVALCGKAGTSTVGLRATLPHKVSPEPNFQGASALL